MTQIEWSPKQLNLIDLKANPQNDQTNEELAKTLHIGNRTIYRWFDIPGFWDAVYERAMSYLEGELPKVLSSLAKEANAGNVNAIKLLLQHTGKLIEKVEVDHRLGVQVLVVTAEFDVTGKSALPKESGPKELKSVV